MAPDERMSLLWQKISDRQKRSAIKTNLDGLGSHHFRNDQLRQEIGGRYAVRSTAKVGIRTISNDHKGSQTNTLK